LGADVTSSLNPLPTLSSWGKLECASAAGSDYIVTGDKDLLRLGEYDSMRILTVSDFLELGKGRAR
jgi:hypothetical protein